jgi:hypothetical protein
MEATLRENRILRALVVLLLALALGGVVLGDGQQAVPGLGTGVVDVRVGGEVPVVQRGDWRTSVLGHVSVQGTVAALPPMPPLVQVGSGYALKGPSIDMIVTVRQLHESGWALVTAAETGQQQWVNLAVMSSIRPR